MRSEKCIFGQIRFHKQLFHQISLVIQRKSSALSPEKDLRIWLARATSLQVLLAPRLEPGIFTELQGWCVRSM